MTVAQLLEVLSRMPPEAVVLLNSGDGLSLVASVEQFEAQGPGQPAEVLLAPSFDE